MIKEFLMDVFLCTINSIIFVFRLFDYAFSFLLTVFNQRSKKIKSNKYAVLVSGSGLLESYLLGFNKIHKEAYLGLKKRGYKDEEIFILSFARLHRSFNKSPNPNNLRKVFEFIKNNSDKNTKTVFHFIGHGNIKDGKSTMELGLQSINSLDFFEIANYIQGKKIFIFDQCHSEGFFKYLKNMKSVVILASTKEKYVATDEIQVEIDFWKEIALGRNIIEAYKYAGEKYGKPNPLVMEILRVIYGNRVGNFYNTYKNSNIDI